MTLSRKESSYSYMSQSGNNIFYFSIVYDFQGNVTVRDICTPVGPFRGSNSSIPEFVTIDIQTAINQVRTLQEMSNVANGQLVFTEDVTKTVTFPSAMANTNYRVTFSTTDFLLVKVSNKTINSFDVVTNVTYTGLIGYDVFI